MNRYIKYSVYFTIGLYVVITVYGLLSLLASPYTGIMMRSMCEGTGCVRDIDVDEGSPAWSAGLRPGDVIVDVNGKGIPSIAFIDDPDYISSMKDTRIFWDSQRYFYSKVSIGKPLNVIIERGGTRFNTVIVPAEFPLMRVIGRIWKVSLIYWSFLFIGFLIIRKRVNEVTVVLFFWILCGAIGDTTAFYIQYHDIAYPYIPLRIFNLINEPFGTLVPFLYLHLALIFPRRNWIIERYPAALYVLYTVGIIVSLFDFLKITGDMSLTHHLMNLFSGTLFLYAYFREQDPVYKRQIKLAAFGLSVPLILSFALILLPENIWDAPLIQYDAGFFFAIFFPLSLFLAVSRYGLMEIEDIFDWTVIFGLTILALMGIEVGFLSLVSPYIAKPSGSILSSSLFTVLVIVLAYMPVRNHIKRWIERLFKHGVYQVEEEVQRFTLTAGICDRKPVLNKLAGFVKNLLGPSGILILNVRSRPSLFLSEGDKAEEMIDILSHEATKLCEFFINKRGCIYGYELIDRGVLREEFERDINSAMFIPVFIGNDPAYLCVLFPKWNNKTYNKRDRLFLDTVSMNVSHILEADEMRHIKKEMEEVYQRDRENVMKEMHDGLGSILTNITVASQVAGQVFDGNTDKAKEMVGVIRSYSAEASDFLRTGLTVMDNPNGEMGHVITHIRHRLGGMIETCGINVRFEVGEGVDAVKTAAHINLNIIRCVQEAFNNILKHSGARNVEVGFQRHSDKGIRIEIADDGKGFEWQGHQTTMTGTDIPKTSGRGLHNIAKRIEDLSGHLHITTSPGCGTRMILTVPV